MYHSHILLWKNKKNGWWKKPVAIFLLIVLLLLVVYYIWKRTIENLDITTTIAPSSMPTPLLWFKFNDGDITKCALKNYGSGASGIVVNTTINTLNFKTGSGSLYLDGTNYIICPDPGFSTNGFTITCWINYETAGYINGRLFDFGNGPANDNITYCPISGFTIWYGSTSKTNPGAANTGYLANSAWTHIAITMTYANNTSGTSNLILYVNGINYYSTTSAYYPQIVKRYLCYIGKSNWTVDTATSGAYIDDFRYYESVLTEKQITSIYNDGFEPNDLKFENGSLVQTTFTPYQTISTTTTSNPSPTTTNMTVWLDASKSEWSSGIWYNLAPSTTVSPIYNTTTFKGTWTSSSLVSNAINGLPALYFDGTNYLSIPEPAQTYANGATVFVVFQASSTITTTSRTLVSRTISNYPAYFDMYNATRVIGNGTGTVTTYSSTINLGTLCSNANIFAFRVKNPGTTTSIQIDEWLDTFSPTAKFTKTGAVANADNATNTYIGTRGNNATSFGGYIGEIIMYKSSLSDTEVSTVNTYLINKWGKTWSYKPNMLGTYSVRLFVSSYYGPIICLRRSSDNSTQDFYTDTTQSYLSTGPNNTGISLKNWLMAGNTSTTTTPSITTAYVCVWYDQSGKNLHAINTNNDTTQPAFVQITTPATKYVLQFDTTKKTVLGIAGAQPNTLCCHFYNTNALQGTIISTSLVDYGQRFGTTGTSVVGACSGTKPSIAGDLYACSTGQKYCYNNGVSTTTVLLNAWNVLSISLSSPYWASGSSNYTSFVNIGQDAYSSVSRSLTGYMTEIVLYNTVFSDSDMSQYYNNRLF